MDLRLLNHKMKIILIGMLLWIADDKIYLEVFLYIWLTVHLNIMILFLIT